MSTCEHLRSSDDASPRTNKHATEHFHASKPPTIRSFEPDESWKWCYVDEIEG
jgi:hypothetical protein